MNTPDEAQAILPVTPGQCPNPWCVSTTRPLPAFSSRSETWRVVCACGIRSFGAETEAEAVEVWNAATDPNGLPARVEKLIAERTLDGCLASEVARMVQGCQSHSLPGDVGMREALERVIDWQAERGADDQILPADAQESWIADAMRVLAKVPARDTKPIDDVADELWLDLVEKDDRTSPEEYPDMALITFEELRAVIRYVADLPSDQSGDANNMIAALTPSALSGDAGEGE